MHKDLIKATMNSRCLNTGHNHSFYPANTNKTDKSESVTCWMCTGCLVLINHADVAQAYAEIVAEALAYKLAKDQEDALQAPNPTPSDTDSSPQAPEKSACN